MRIRYYCHAGLETGFGRAALDYALALARHGGVELDLRLLPSTSSLPERGRELAKCVNAGGEPDVVLVHTLPRDCYRVIQIEGLHDIPNVAYTTWEALSLPEQIGWDLFEFDAVATPSYRSATPIRERFASYFDTGLGMHRIEAECINTVKIVPHTYDPAVLTPFGDNDNTDRGFYDFYYVGAWNRRKNVDGLVRAFIHAFGDDPTVHLDLRCAGAPRHAFLGACAAAGHPDPKNIHFDNARISDERMRDVVRISECFVTATRGEAWNLPAFEALIGNRHVIAPANMGHEDFLARTSADLVDVTPTPAALDVSMEELPNGALRVAVSGPTGITSRVEWLEPDLIALSHAMQAARARRARTIESEYDVARRFSYEAVAPQLIAVLEEARNV